MCYGVLQEIFPLLYFELCSKTNSKCYSRQKHWYLSI